MRNMAMASNWKLIFSNVQEKLENAKMQERKKKNRNSKIKVLDSRNLDDERQFTCNLNLLD